MHLIAADITVEVLTMRRIEFSEDVVRQLAHGSVHHPHPLVRRRMQALLWRAEGQSRKRIAELLGVRASTIGDYVNLFLRGGVEALQELRYRGRPNRLLERKDEILAVLEASPPTTLKEAQARIKAATGLERSLPQVRAFLKKTEFAAAQ
ncbi:MAG: helix-turn-helix domain-containing protein [Armatimonadetes bacterium]|nr:helix-turn-helix domain-containing protein [Armatimonadota bacterium]NDK15441.1 helix-turn-helix domain-containing protein [Armatimonadota bacterium]